MQINGLQHLQAAQSLTGSQRSSASARTEAAPETGTPLPVDELDLSAEAQALSGMQAADASGDIRWDKVNALRQAIADGNYETSDRISGALDSFLDAYA